MTEGRSQNELIAGYWETGPVGRFLKLGRIRSLVDAKFIVPRLLGMWIFTALRIRLEKLRNLRAVR